MSRCFLYVYLAVKVSVRKEVSLMSLHLSPGRHDGFRVRLEGGRSGWVIRKDVS